MKIVYWSPYVGHVGTIKAVVNSAVAARRYGHHEVSIIRNHSEWQGYEEQLSASGVQIVDFGLKKWFPRLARTSALGSRLYMLVVAFFGFFQLYIYMRRERPDVLITNLIAVPAMAAAALLPRPPRLIASIQGFPKFLGTKEPPYPLWMKVEDWMRQKLWNIFYSRADLLVCMTEATIEKLVQNTSLRREKFTRINNPIVDDQLFTLSSEPLADPWFVQDRYKSLVSIGRLTRQKDFATLIRAIELVCKEMAVRVAILGEGDEREMLAREIAAKGLEDRIRLYGFVSNPYPYLHHADLFVLTSRWEDPGHAILEAAALRVPIVSTDCPSGPASLLRQGEGGELCPVGDFTCLAAKIIKSLRNPDPHKSEVAYENAFQFSLRAHYEALAHYLDSWTRTSQ